MSNPTPAPNQVLASDQFEPPDTQQPLLGGTENSVCKLSLPLVTLAPVQMPSDVFIFGSGTVGKGSLDSLEEVSLLNSLLSAAHQKYIQTRLIYYYVTAN